MAHDKRTAPATPATDDEPSDIGIGDDILIVDDTPANLVAFEAALAPLGRRLVLAHSGKEALARCSTRTSRWSCSTSRCPT